MRLFTESGFNGLFRMTHAMAAFMWMGLLWFFNFVQVPAFAEMDPVARNNALDKQGWRALWWFRHSAWLTVATGILVFGVDGVDGMLYDGDFMKTSGGMVLTAAIAFALIMLYNVWMVIWPNQQIVIANARSVQGGGEADPAAPAAARKAAMASRQNLIFSMFVVPAMIGGGYTGVFFSGFDTINDGGLRVLYWIVIAAIAVGMELNALGIVGGTAPGGTNIVYDTHANALHTGLGITVFVWLFFEIFFGKI